MIDATYRYLTTAPRKREYQRRRHLRSPYDFARTLCGSAIGKELALPDIGTYAFLGECLVCKGTGHRPRTS